MCKNVQVARPSASESGGHVEGRGKRADVSPVVAATVDGPSKIISIDQNRARVNGLT